MSRHSGPHVIQRYELERQVVAALIMTASLIESSEILTTATFSSETFKKIFAYIAETRENGGPEKIDELMLANAVGITLAEVMKITAGCYCPQPEAFAAWVRELELWRLSQRILKVSGDESAALLRTGEVDLANIAAMMEIWQEILKLDRPAQGPAFKRLSEINGRSISWLWPGRIPLGMLTLVAGDPGLGKSFFMTWLASKLSVGAILPGATSPALTGSTVYLAAEDSPSFALQPRAERNGGNLSKIMVLDDSEFDIAADLEKIRAIVALNTDVKLVIIDPLNSYIGDADYFKDPSIRSKLQPLVRFAEDSSIAVLGVMHLNKKTDQAGIYRIGGSIAFAGIARSILAVTQDPDDPDRRFLRPLKMNYCRQPDPLAFRIGEDLSLVFEDGPADVTADGSLSAPTGRKAREGSFAANWLAGILAEGPLELKDILTASEAIGISRSALFRASAKLNADTRASGFGKGKTTLWGLPSGQ